jgi:hypothetical protein
MEKKFEGFFDRIGWGLLTAVAVYASTQLAKLSESVSQLNTNIAVIVTKMNGYEMQSKEIKDRVSVIETEIWKGK